MKKSGFLKNVSTWKRIATWICITESFCCTLETNVRCKSTILQYKIQPKKINK